MFKGGWTKPTNTTDALRKVSLGQTCVSRSALSQPDFFSQSHLGRGEGLLGVHGYSSLIRHITAISRFVVETIFPYGDELN